MGTGENFARRTAEGEEAEDVGDFVAAVFVALSRVARVVLPRRSGDVWAHGHFNGVAGVFGWHVEDVEKQMAQRAAEKKECKNTH